MLNLLRFRSLSRLAAFRRLLVSRSLSSFGHSVLTLCLAITCPAIYSQSTTDGAIGGTLLDPSGAAIRNAVILATSNSSSFEASTSTDSTGNFRFLGLPPGSYRVEVRITPYTPYTANSIRVEIGEVTTLSPRLSLGAQQQTVIVKEEAPLIDTTSAGLSTNLDQNAVHGLPSNGRRWSDFALLTPTVTPDQEGRGLLSFRGISVLLNNNTMDGADNNQAFFSEERGRTRMAYSTTEASVREFQVNTSNYSAQYGRAAGGVVNTVTHSGSNALHGSSFFYDRDSEWGAQNPFTQLTTQPQPGTFASTPFTPRDQRLQWGLAIGGPLVHRRLFGFFAYDQQARDYPAISQPGNAAKFYAEPTSNELTALAARLGVHANEIARQQYNSVLTGLATETGLVPRSASQLIFFPKVDYQPDDRNHYALQYNHMQSNSPNGVQSQTSAQYGVSSFGNSVVKGDWAVARWNTFLTSTQMNELLLQYGRDFEAELSTPATSFEQPMTRNPAGTAPQVSILSSSYGLKIGKPAALDRVAFPDEHRTQVKDVYTQVIANHVLKAGIDFNHVADLTRNLYGGGGQYVYDSMTGFVADLLNPNHCGIGADSYGNLPCYSYFQQALGPSRFNMSTNDYAVFVSDEWRALHNLTFSLGIRYEFEQLPQPSGTLVNPDIPQTAKIPEDRNNFGPRLGLAWNVFGSGDTVVRAGYGIFYGRIINSTISSALVSTGAPNGQLSYRIKPIDQGAPQFPYVFASFIANSIKPAAVFFDPKFQAPQVHQLEVSIQQQLGFRTDLTISALASLGRELPNFVDTNIDPAAVSTITYQVKDPSQSGPLPLEYRTKFFTGRLNPNYQQITDIFSETNSKYEAAVVTLKHHMRSHFEMNANYTYAHAMDFNQNETTFADANDLMDPTNFAAEYGPSNFDVRQRSTGYVLMRSPFHAHGFAGLLLNGYAAAPTISAQSGLPFSMRTGGSIPALRYYDVVNRLETQSGLGYSLNGSGGDNRIPGFVRNNYRYPGTISTDARLSKNTTITEHVHVELLAEVFNLLNHQNATSVNTTGYYIGNPTRAGEMPTLTYNTSKSGSPLFGTVTNANSNTLYRERQLQLGVKLAF